MMKHTAYILALVAAIAIGAIAQPRTRTPTIEFVDAPPKRVLSESVGVEPGDNMDTITRETKYEDGSVFRVVTTQPVDAGEQERRARNKRLDEYRDRRDADPIIVDIIDELRSR